ncbi:MAG: flagellar basal body-associated protein FliL [Limimaricola sp.]|uniref:flagellar basal body-associated FliL family protein n=1 Tax=Limimaricola sp. TaxID=2211665 RepID=UPI001D7E6736|nr:flagellar basal body-associated FliL family protein [Limimaricola sp.]MBI1417341.1 flagellar basal body-associated protein FliL [Limimaricola sp.]
MKRFLLPLLLALVGTAAGAGAGWILGGAASSTDHATAEGPAPAATQCDPGTTTAAAVPDAAATHDYARLNSQFVVPVVEGGQVTALVALSLSIEVPTGRQHDVFDVEPKLRDALLQVLFDHANLGGFGGDFTSGSNMRVLRASLLKGAQGVLGPMASDVLIIDIARQNV